MAGGVNKVILVGHLGADPDMRYTPSGQGVCELRLATSESWNDKNGQRQERTEWHRIVVWGKRAEVPYEDDFVDSAGHDGPSFVFRDDSIPWCLRCGMTPSRR